MIKFFAVSSFTMFVLMISVGPASAANGLATVKDHGAVGNGIADDSTAFETAIALNKIVHVPAGRYRLTRSISIPPGGGLVGPGTLYIDWNSSSNHYALVLNGNGIRVDGIRIEKKFVDGSYATGIYADRRVDIAIRDVEILNFSARYGIHLVECTDFEISRCNIHNFMVNTTTDMIQDSPAGIRITRSLRGVVSGNMLRKIEVGPVGLTSISPIVPSYGPQGYQSDHITAMQCRNITFTGNTMETSGEGIDILLSESCTLTGNVIRDIWFQGIKMLGSSFCTVGKNQISDCYQGIGLNDGALNTICFGNVIVGNMIRDTGSPGSFGVPGPGRVNYQTTYGISVGGNSDYNQISENVVLDTQTTKTMASPGILNNGRPNNRIAENLVSNSLTYPSLDPF